jgi:hypothetical protein
MDQTAKRRHREVEGPIKTTFYKLAWYQVTLISFEYLNVGPMGSAEAFYCTYTGYFGPFLLFVGLRAKSFCVLLVHVAGCVRAGIWLFFEISGWHQKSARLCSAALSIAVIHLFKFISASGKLRGSRMPGVWNLLRVVVGVDLFFRVQSLPGQATILNAMGLQAYWSFRLRARFLPLSTDL